MHQLLRKVVDHGVQVTSLHGRQDVLDGVHLGDAAVVLLQLLAERTGVAGAQPVHAVVHDIVDLGVPGVVHRKHSHVVVWHTHVAAVLKAVDHVLLTVTDADDQVAGAVGVGDALGGALEGGLELQDVTQDEHPGLAVHLLRRSVVGALAKGVVGVGHLQ